VIDCRALLLPPLLGVRALKRRLGKSASPEGLTSANVYDSFGEALLARRHRARGYQLSQSLELDPGNKNAANILKRIAR